jgi:glycosyltransferase involved in cell wall biosynthesis
MRPGILYITFDGLLDPIPYSQVIPYLEGFAGDGRGIHVLSFEKRGGEGRKREILELRGRLEKRGIRWRYFAWRNRPYVIAQLFNLLEGFLTILVLACRGEIAVIHARSYPAGLLALTFKYLLGIRFLFDMRGFWADEKVDAGLWKKGGMLYRLTKRIERRLVTGADRVVVLSNRARKLLPGLVGRNHDELPPVDVIPCCVEVERFAGVSRDEIELRRRELGFPPDAVVVAYLGSVGTFYKFEEALDFFKVWRAVRANVRLLVMTPTSHDEVREILRRKNIPAGDWRLMSLRPEAVPAHLATAHVGLALFSMTFSKEASSAVRVAEYLAAGLLMVVSDKGGDIPAMVEKEEIGAVITRYSEDEYLRAVRRLEGLWPRLRDCQKRSRTLARESFSHEIGLERYLRIYRELAPTQG